MTLALDKSRLTQRPGKRAGHFREKGRDRQTPPFMLATFVVCDKNIGVLQIGMDNLAPK